MTTQSEALRLADRLQLRHPEQIDQQDLEDAAAELRRLQGFCEDAVTENIRQADRIAALEKALGIAAEALEMVINNPYRTETPSYEAVIDDGFQALAAARQALGDNK